MKAIRIGQVDGKFQDYLDRFFNANPNAEIVQVVTHESFVWTIIYKDGETELEKVRKELAEANREIGRLKMMVEISNDLLGEYLKSDFS